MAEKTIEQVYIIVEDKQLDVAASQLIGVRVDQALDLPDMAEFTLVDARQWVIDGTFESGKEIKLDLEQDKKRLNIFMGLISGVDPEFKAKGETKLRVRCFDQSHLLSRGRQSKTFVQVKDSDIAGTIARKYGWGTDIEPTELIYDQLSQHNLTDLEFLRQRASRIGYQVGVNNKKLYFKPKGSPIRPGGDSNLIDLEFPKTMAQFSARLSSAGIAKKVTVRGWDPATKKNVIGEATRSDKAPETSMGKGAGDGASKFNASGELSLEDTAVYSQKEAEILAKAKLDQLATSYIIAEGTCAGDPSLQPGARVKVAGTGNFDGTYTVADTIHRFDSSGYKTVFKTGHGAPEASPLGDALKAGRDGGSHPQIAIGIVVDTKDPLEEGRVKVKLPWLAENMQTDWCRIIAPGAGKDRGFYWLPEVDDEVMLAFEMGNVARPYVIGGLWNRSDLPPKKDNADVLDDSAVIRRLMKSRSGHVIQFDDTRGDEKVEIQDKKGNKIVFECATDKLTIEFAGDIDISSQKNVNIKAGLAVSIEAGTSFSAKGNTTAEIEGTGTATVKASGALQLQGATVNVNNGAIVVA